MFKRFIGFLDLMVLFLADKFNLAWEVDLRQRGSFATLMGMRADDIVIGRKYLCHVGELHAVQLTGHPKISDEKVLVHWLPQEQCCDDAIRDERVSSSYKYELSCMDVKGLQPGDLIYLLHSGGLGGIVVAVGYGEGYYFSVVGNWYLLDKNTRRRPV